MLERDDRPVLCMGGVHMDRIARPASGALSLGQSNPVSISTAPGGVAHNVAVALAARTRPVVLIGAVGGDADGDRIRRSLAARGIDPASLVRDEHHATGSYTAVLDGAGELVVGLADMAIHEAPRSDRLLAQAARHRGAAALVLDSNLPAEIIGALCDRARAGAVFAVAASAAKAPRLGPHLPRLAGLFVDRDEAAALSGRPCGTEAEAREAALSLVTAGAARVFVTLGTAGALAAEAGNAAYRPATSRAAQDVTGAGDAFAAAAIDRLLRAGSLEAALDEGLAAARDALARDGAVPPAA